MMKSKIYALLLTCFLATQSTLMGQENVNQFVPESAFALIDIDVSQIKQQFVNEEGQFVSDYFPTEVLTAMGQTYLGFDYMLINRIRIVVAEGEDSLQDLRVGLIYDFAEAVDIGSKFEAEEASYQVGDKDVFMDMDFGLECLQLDEKTVFHATVDFMADLVNAKDVSTPLTALLDSSTGKGSEVLGLLSFDQIKEKYAAMVEETPIPKPMSFLNAAPRYLKSAEFRIANHMMTLDMLSEDEKSAGKLQMTAKRLVGLAKESAKSSMADMMMGMDGDPVGESMAAYLERLIDTIATDVAPKKEENRVKMQLRTDAAWVSILFPMLFGFFVF